MRCCSARHSRTAPSTLRRSARPALRSRSPHPALPWGLRGAPVRPREQRGTAGTGSGAAPHLLRVRDVAGVGQDEGAELVEVLHGAVPPGRGGEILEGGGE